MKPQSTNAPMQSGLQSGPQSGLPTKALILAAGVGKRLAGAGAEGHPKALLTFDGVSLIARHIAILRDCGVDQITVVTGHGADLLKTALADLGEPAIAVLFNPDYRTGSVVSLWTGRDVLRSGAPIILMDADVIYDRRLMQRLIGSANPDCLLLDREIEPGDEPVKLCIQNGHIVDFHKRPQHTHEWHGESVGFFRFTSQAAQELADRADAYVTSGRGNMEYEEPVRDMILASPPTRFGFEDVSGLPWTEIDFPEDVAKASALLPELVA